MSAQEQVEEQVVFAVCAAVGFDPATDESVDVVVAREVRARTGCAGGHPPGWEAVDVEPEWAVARGYVPVGPCAAGGAEQAVGDSAWLDALGAAVESVAAAAVAARGAALRGLDEVEVHPHRDGWVELTAYAAVDEAPEEDGE